MQAVDAGHSTADVTHTQSSYMQVLMLLDKIEEGRLTISLTISLTIICMESGVCYAWFYWRTMAQLWTFWQTNHIPQGLDCSDVSRVRWLLLL